MHDIAWVSEQLQHVTQNERTCLEYLLLLSESSLKALKKILEEMILVAAQNKEKDPEATDAIISTDEPETVMEFRRIRVEAQESMHALQKEMKTDVGALREELQNVIRKVDSLEGDCAEFQNESAAAFQDIKNTSERIDDAKHEEQMKKKLEENLAAIRKIGKKVDSLEGGYVELQKQIEDAFNQVAVVVKEVSETRDHTEEIVRKVDVLASDRHRLRTEKTIHALPREQDNTNPHNEIEDQRSQTTQDDIDEVTSQTSHEEVNGLMSQISHDEVDDLMSQTSQDEANDLRSQTSQSDIDEVTGQTSQNEVDDVTTQACKDEYFTDPEVSDSEELKVIFKADVLRSFRLGNYRDEATIRYEDVGINTGLGYNCTTGVFTAPVRGWYRFIVRMEGDNINCVKVVRNSTRSEEINTTLESFDKIMNKGDTIQVTVNGNSSVFASDGEKETSFCGFLFEAD